MNIQQNTYQRVPASDGQQTDLEVSRTPLGLELAKVLDPIEAVFIKQKFEALEVITTFETQNRYFIFNADPDKQEPLNLILAGLENSHWCARNCIPESCRPFEMEVQDTISRRPLLNIVRPFKCTCCCFARPILAAHDLINNNMVIGRITAPFRFCTDYKFSIIDGEDNLIYSFVGDCCQCAMWCMSCPCEKCQTALLSIRNKEGEEVGYVQKKSAGFFKSLVSDVDNYFVKFPANASPTDKYLILTAVLFLDYWLFEGKQDKARGH